MQDISTKKEIYAVVTIWCEKGSKEPKPLQFGRNIVGYSVKMSSIFYFPPAFSTTVHPTHLLMLAVPFVLLGVCSIILQL